MAMTFQPPPNIEPNIHHYITHLLHEQKTNLESEFVVLKEQMKAQFTTMLDIIEVRPVAPARY